MITIGVAIPCFIKHVGLLKRVLDSIETQTRKPDQVVVSCSETEQSDIPYKQSDYSFPLTIITHSEIKNGSENRNIAADSLNTDIISFFDADDIMHPQRIECIETCFTQTDAIAMVHQFQLGSDKQLPYYYGFYDFSNNAFKIDKNNIKAGTKYFSRMIGLENVKDFHNGHITIRRSVLVRFDESGPVTGCEDAVFTGALCETYGISKIYFAPYKLTYYEPQQTLILRHVDMYYKDQPIYQTLRDNIVKDIWCAKN